MSGVLKLVPRPANPAGKIGENAAGTASFTRASSLIGTYDSGEGLWDFPSTYRAHLGRVYRGWSVGALADGTPMIAYRTQTAAHFRKWNGSAWGSPPCQYA
jgi:hypothetical protein